MRVSVLVIVLFQPAAPNPPRSTPSIHLCVHDRTHTQLVRGPAAPSCGSAPRLFKITYSCSSKPPGRCGGSVDSAGELPPNSRTARLVPSPISATDDARLGVI